MEKAYETVEERLARKERGEKASFVVSKKKAGGWLTLILLAVVTFLNETGHITDEQADMAKKGLESEIGVELVDKIEDKVEDAIEE